MVDVWLPYGETEVCARVPARNMMATIKPNEFHEIENIKSEVKKALKEPLGVEGLHELAKSSHKVTLVVKASLEMDVKVNQAVIEVIREELHNAGINDENITIILAYNPITVQTINAESLLSNGLKILHHDPKSSEHVYLGETSKGTKIYLNKMLIEADLRVVISFVEPHPYAGYGGLDVILPGVSGDETIKNHGVLALHPRAKRGVLKHNPAYEDMLEASNLVGIDFSIELARVGDSIVGVFAGSLNETFRRGVKLLESVCKVPIERKADMLLYSSGGAPHDSNLFDALVDLDSMTDILSKDGFIILVAECSMGYGSRDFYDWMRRFKGSADILRALRTVFNWGGYMAYRLSSYLERFNMLLVSALPDYYAVDVFKFKSFRAVNDALRYSINAVGRRSRVVAIPNGRAVIPILKQ